MSNPPPHPGPRPTRLLVFVIAYYAESTLRRVLERIPNEIFSRYDCEILVVDDASGDRTQKIGLEYRAEHPDVAMTVLANAYNQGYGGNQKVGYHYAISEGFDYVAMIHGDGQYAPEELPRLLEPLDLGVADAVFGSRMLVRGAARQGGMPLYKYVGNRILSTAQNFLLHTEMSEFHSGYRVYSTRALKAVHFRLNSNDFHFDTEIILQLLNARLRIVELPIPTYYGDEICRVDGLKYAANVLRVTVGAVFHRAGFLEQRRLDPVIDSNDHYELKLGFPSSHQRALDAIPDRSSVIDLGAGPGGLAQELVRKNCQVAVVDRYPPKDVAPMVAVHVQDLDQALTFDVAPYTYILMLDVIEHLKEPEDFLERLRDQFGYRPHRLVLTTPNVGFVVQRVMLLLGQFNYGRSGILDRTHTRLFTFRTISHLLRDAGFTITTVEGIPAPFEKALGPGPVGRILTRVNMALIWISRTLFSFQIFVEATSTPSIDYIVRENRTRSM